MKKLVSILLAAMLTVCLAVSVMASPSVGQGIKPIGGTVDGEEISADDLGSYITSLGATTNGPLGSLQITLNDAEKIVVNAYVTGANPGDVIIITFPDGHMIEAVVAEDGTITFEVTEDTIVEFSLKTSAPQQPENKPAEGGESTSPKTGETNAYPIACAMAVLFACVAMYAGRKVVK